MTAVALMCSAFPIHAWGQVSGSVRDAATSEPVRGAAVVALGANRELLVRTITSSSGAFRIVHDGAVIVRVMRIGYAPQERRLDGAVSPLVFELVPLGSSLRAVTVTSSPLCRPRADQQEALALWSSATDAFSSMIVSSTEATQTGEVEQLLYDRVVANNGSKILRQSTQRVTSNNVSPIRAARPPAELVQHGYVAHGRDASTYYAPDPQVLLDSSFAATHCLSLHRDEKAHPGEIGVAFTPTSDRDTIADIAGVLWMKRSPMALTSLDFQYRGVDQMLLQMAAGGRLSFETLSNGMPIIREWMVRSPTLHYFPSGPPRGPMSGWIGGRAAMRGEIHEGGGLITDGELGGTRIAAPLASLGGRVQIRTTREPVAGARVVLDSTDDVTVTDAEGRFSLTRLLPGPYLLRATDSVVMDPMRVDSAGRPSSYSGRQQIARRIATIEIQANLDLVSSYTLNFPSPAPSPTCHFEGASGRLYTVVGMVEDTERLPIPHTRVELSWADTTKQWRLDEQNQSVPFHTSTGTSMEVVTDSSGEFVACGIPHSQLIVARLLTIEGVAVGTARVSARPDNVSRRLSNDGLREVRLTVKPPD